MSRIFIKRLTNLAIKKNIIIKNEDSIINDLIYHVNDYNLKKNKVVYNFYGDICLECHGNGWKTCNNQLENNLINGLGFKFVLCKKCNGLGYI
tara:strand:- start:23210 stop:23488 length:279 start_codon:yes stop_codon:yes gene_type:complete